MKNLRNVAIVAHVDHGKTTLVDALLKQSGTFRENEQVAERVMDSNDIEKERGITILSKNTAVKYNDIKINIVDTPGHADFGGEVERVLKMVDGVILVVDAFDGPMPQTRFVLSKALALNLVPIVVVNKVDRPGARPTEVVDEVLELFMDLNASDEQLDFKVVYASAKNGYAMTDLNDKSDNMKPLFETIVNTIPEPAGEDSEPLQLLVANIDSDEYTGRVGIGRITKGCIKNGQEVAICKKDGTIQKLRIGKLYTYSGLKRVETEVAHCGDIVAVNGVIGINIGETIADPENPVAVPFVDIDEPTVSILIENMRREGYELLVSRPKVIYKVIDGVKCEPMEMATIDVPEEFVGTVMQKMGYRKGEMTNMTPSTSNAGYTRLEFKVPARGLIGFRNEFMTDTKGNGMINHIFAGYEPDKGEIETRQRGAVIAFEAGKATGYGLFQAQERSTLFIGPGTEVYQGMIVGENSRSDDLTVNVCKEKHLTNTRASGSDDALKLVPPVTMSLEQSIEFISDDELVEVTPENIRLRKKILDPTMRIRAKNSK